METIQAQSINERSKNAKGKNMFILFAVCSLLLLLFSSGCGNKFFDPTQVGRFRPVPAVNVILDSLGVAEETKAACDQGEEPRPADTVAMETDYVFSSGDVVRISIFELLQEGAPFENEYVVTETGKISIPEVFVVEAAGLTEIQLEEEIRRILSPSILREPSVVVTLLASQQRTYSIIGVGVPAPGRYGIPRYDYRLTDALATAGGVHQFNVSYIFVSRSIEGQTAAPELIRPGFDIPLLEPEIKLPDITQPGVSEQQMLEIIAPRAQHHQWPASKVVITSSEMATDGELGTLSAQNSFELLANDAQEPASEKEMAGGYGSSENLGMLAGPAEDEQVSVSDILKTLAERSRREKAANGRTNTSETASPSVGSVRPRVVESPESDLPQRRTLSSGTPGPEEPLEIDRLLKTMGGQPGSENLSRQTSWDQVFQSTMTEPGRSRGQEDIGLDELLKSFAEPGTRGGKMDEQFTVGGVDELIDVPAQPTGPGRGDVVGKEQAERIEWIFQDGKWVPMPVGTAPLLPKPMIKVEPVVRPFRPVEERPVSGYEWSAGAKTRLIKIPADKLLAGDARYNIVVKPGDSIYVPVDVIGEFCIMGNVNRQGYIPITGRPLTLKMAIAAAGGLGPLAWPKRCEVVRRIGRKKEEIVMVDLDKIASGEQPDFFIKPNDLINVGTHATARWRAVLRNSFRATYGFGFIYDRNFADRDFYNSPWPF